MTDSIMTNTNVFNQVNINEIPLLNVDKLKSQLQDYFTPFMCNYLKSENTKNFKINEGIAEYIVKNALTNGKKVGEGNYPVDVIDETSNIGIDVGAVCCNGNWTNEKSIMQKFKMSENLDILFNENRTEEAIKLFTEAYIEKLNKVSNLNLYYLIFITIKENIYLCLFKLSKDNIINVKCNGCSETTIKCSNFIDEKSGKVILYKSKKRLEIRWNKNIINNDKTIKIY